MLRHESQALSRFGFEEDMGGTDERFDRGFESADDSDLAGPACRLFHQPPVPKQTPDTSKLWYSFQPGLVEEISDLLARLKLWSLSALGRWWP